LYYNIFKDCPSRTLEKCVGETRQPKRQKANEY